jgi:hypothetical protein
MSPAQNASMSESVSCCSSIRFQNDSCRSVLCRGHRVVRKGARICCADFSSLRFPGLIDAKKSIGDPNEVAGKYRQERLMLPDVFAGRRQPEFRAPLVIQAANQPAVMVAQIPNDSARTDSTPAFLARHGFRPACGCAGLDLWISSSQPFTRVVILSLRRKWPDAFDGASGFPLCIGGFESFALLAPANDGFARNQNAPTYAGTSPASRFYICEKVVRRFRAACRIRR